MDSIKKILIIEDNKDIRTVLARRMSSLGFETLMAEDGITGLEKARSGWPDVIILDLTLPKMSGQEVCKAIREDHNKEFARIPIIMLTGKTDEVDRVIGMVIGASCYLTKPYDPKELVSLVLKYAEGEDHAHHGV